jgi:hypothetical protein
MSQNKDHISTALEALQTCQRVFKHNHYQTEYWYDEIKVRDAIAALQQIKDQRAPWSMKVYGDVAKIFDGTGKAITSVYAYDAKVIVDAHNSVSLAPHRGVKLADCSNCGTQIIVDVDMYVAKDQQAQPQCNYPKCECPTESPCLQGRPVDQQAHGAMPDAYLVSYKEVTNSGTKQHCVIASLEPHAPTIMANEDNVRSRELICAKPLYAAPQPSPIDKEVVAKLNAAIEHIRAMPHGDNCFLHNDGGEFDRCFCGKDGLLNWLESDTKEPAKEHGRDDE